MIQSQLLKLMSSTSILLIGQFTGHTVWLIQVSKLITVSQIDYYRNFKLRAHCAVLPVPNGSQYFDVLHFMHVCELFWFRNASYNLMQLIFKMKK